MAEQPVKIKFEYKNPDNVEAVVPDAQILRAGENEVSHKKKQKRSKTTHGPAVDHTKLNRRHSNNEDKNDAIKTVTKPLDKTKIPVSRFRQTVDKVKGRRGSKDVESHIPIPRSSIPKQTNKAPTKPLRKSVAAVKTEVNEPTAAPEDEFDKLYEEVAHSPTPVNIEVPLLDPDDDPEKLASKFEEIIHDYDEKRVEPVNTGKVKSKIPFLKRRSQQEIDVRGRSDKIIAARDKLRIRHSLADINDLKRDETAVAVNDEPEQNGVVDENVNIKKAIDNEIIYDNENNVEPETVAYVKADEAVNDDEAVINPSKHSDQINVVQIVDDITDDATVNDAEAKVDRSIDQNNHEQETVADLTDIAAVNVLEAAVDSSITYLDNVEQETVADITDNAIADAIINVAEVVVDRSIHNDQNNVDLETVSDVRDYVKADEAVNNKETVKAEHHGDQNIAEDTVDNVTVNVIIAGAAVNDIETTEAETVHTDYNNDVAPETGTVLTDDIKTAVAENDNEADYELIRNDNQNIMELERDADHTNNAIVAATVNVIEDAETVHSDLSNDVPVTVTDNNHIGVQAELVNDNSIEVDTVENAINTEIDETNDIKTEVAITPEVYEDVESTEVVHTTTEAETGENTDKMEKTKEELTEENIQKDFIKIAIPVYDSVVYEQTENIETDKIVEIEKTDNPTNNDLQDKFEASVEINEIKNKPLITEVIPNTEQSTIEVVDATDNPNPGVSELLNEIEDRKTVMKEKDSIDKTNLRGKVGELISKIDSNKTIASDKMNFGNEMPKKVSVMTKIAMFEKHKELSKSKIPTKDNKPQKLTTNIKVNEDSHVNTPLIVDELFKQSETTGNFNKNNKINDGDNIEIVRAEMVFIDSPEIRLKDIDKADIKPNAFIKPKIAEEVLMPTIRKEPEILTNDKVNKQCTDPVNVYKFTPVKEVLKRYESINKKDVNKIDNLPKGRPIREIIKERSFKSAANQKPLDAMFAHQITPVNDILNDIKHKSKAERPEDNFDKDFHKGQGHDKTKHGFKPFKPRDYNDDNFKSLQYIQDYHDAKIKNDDLKRAKSLVELDLGDAVKGKVNTMIVRMSSIDKIEAGTKEATINHKEMPMRRSVSAKVAMFERKLTPVNGAQPLRPKREEQKQESVKTPVDLPARLQELSAGKQRYRKMADMPRIPLANGVTMPVLAVGTALLDPNLAFQIVCTAIDLGYRAIDTAPIYGNEKVIGDAIRAKINDGTVTREELFVISKLWSTNHRTDLVKAACKASLAAMGLDYFDLYLIHNPMSFKEGASPIPKIATVLQYSESDYLDAWFGMETLGSRARAVGVSNFNSSQIKRVMDRARVKPVVNQVECHPYLSQQKLDAFCSDRNITLSCFGVLGSKGTPEEFKSGHPAAIDDPLVQVLASGLNVSPAQLLIRYQLECGHHVVVKSSTAAHLWDNLQSLTFNLTSGQVDALHALNRNKRNFSFRGMGDTHKNYPFNAAF